jgi:hypothetical protein
VGGKVEGNLGEDGLLAEGLVDVPGHDVVAEESGEVAVVEEDSHHLADGAVHLAPLTQQEHHLIKIGSIVETIFIFIF